MAARIAADGPSAEAHGPDFVRASLQITNRIAYWQPWADWRLGARFWRETFDDLVDDDLAEFGPAPPAALRAALADELLQSATLDLGRVLARPAPAAFTALFTAPAGAPATSPESHHADS
jgi:hypothetical protein